jgi:hypothetical protein
MHAEDQGLVDRVEAKMLSFSDGYEDTMRCAFLMVGDTERGNAESAEVLWKDPESKSLAVVVQAAQIMRTQLEAPIEMCWELLGWTPQKIQLAMELMKLPPGGGPAAPPVAFGSEPKPAEGNNPATHPGNQKGQPSGHAAQPSE